ncbi:MAG: hypothetical protein PHO48_03365, partial [Candidatus Gracilibacteria bacterium]|nr:hypothetical protein [Candidatus Gracilibacteria bacterium]
MGSTTPKVETPKKATPAEVLETATQIAALKNNVEKSEAKIKADFGRLEGRINAVIESREASAEELGEINDKLKNLLDSLEIEQFTEKLEVSRAIILYLRANPKVKPEDLNPADFAKKNPDLQKSEIWKNILEDAVRGLEIINRIENPDFDYKNPKAYMKKAGDIWDGVVDVAQKNPVLTGICLLGGAYALYQFLAEDGVWSKVKGTVAAGGSVLLGLSLFGDLDLNKKAKQWLLDSAIDPKDQETVKGYVAKAKKKASDALGLNETPQDDYDKHTQEWVEKLKERKDYENAFLYKLMRDYAKSGGVAISKENVLADCEKMERGEEISNRAQYASLISGEDTTIKVFDWGIEIIPGWLGHIAAAGGYTAYRIVREELVFFKNLSNWIFNKNAENASAFFGQWGKNAIIVSGVLTAWDYLSKSHRSLLMLPKNIGKGIAWPVYGAEVMGKGISKSAQFFGSPKLLGRWESTGKIFRFIDTTGKVIASFNPSNPIMKLWDKAKGKWETQKVAVVTPATQSTSETLSPTAEAARAEAARMKSVNSAAETNAIPEELPGKARAGNVTKGNFGKNNPTPAKAPYAAVEGNTALALKSEPAPAESGVLKPTDLLDKAKAAEELNPLQYKEYTETVKAKGGTPLSSEVISTKFQSVARVGGEAMRVLGAVGLCMMIHNVSEAADKRKALVDTGAELGVFMGALRLTPGHPLLRLVVAIGATAGVSLMTEDLRADISAAMPNWINHPSLDKVWTGVDILSGGNIIGLISNSVYTGKNAEEFLKREVSILDGNGVGKMRLNSVGDWNKKQAEEMLKISEKIVKLAQEITKANPERKNEILVKMQELKKEYAAYESLKIDEKWDKRKASELLMAKAAIAENKSEIESLTGNASAAEKQIIQEFLAGSAVEESRKNRNPSKLKDLLAKIQNPTLKKALEEYAALSINYAAELDFVKSIG